MMENVACGLCGHNNTKLIHEIEGQDDATISIVKCQNCKLVYINPRFESAEMSDFYDDEYFIFNDALQVRQIIYAIDALKEIKQFKSEGKLLDIGSAKGIFPLTAQKFGFIAQGLEISEYAANFSKNAFGIDTISGTLEEATLSKEQFDIITMFDVIEHFRNPKNSLTKVRPALKMDGILVVDTPNLKSIYSKFRGKYWAGYGKYHLYYYSPETLIKLLIDTGFEPILSKSHKIDLISFDSLWRWGIADYRLYWKLERTFILSKLMKDINAPTKEMYKIGEFNQIKELTNRQIENAIERKSVILKLFKIINHPSNLLFGKMFAGDAIRVIARKSNHPKAFK